MPKPNKPGKKPKKKPAPAANSWTPIYAEANTTTTDLGGMRGKAYKGTGQFSTGLTGGGSLIPGVGTSKPPKPPKLTKKARKTLKNRGNRKASGVPAGSHINKQGQVVPNKGKKSK